MYEELIAYLLGKKNDFTDADLEEFIELLNNALEVTDEYELHRKQSVIENMVDCTAVEDKEERAAISTAIDSMLQLDCEDETDLFEDRHSNDVPLRSLKFTRGLKTSSERAPTDKRSTRGTKVNSVWKAEKESREAIKKVKAADGKAMPSQETQVAEASAFIEQEDLLKSANGSTCTPKKTVYMDGKPKVRFSELFANAYELSRVAAAAGNKHPGKTESGAVVEKSDASDEFKFDIGQLEDNNNDGPDVIFNTEDDE